MDTGIEPCFNQYNKKRTCSQMGKVKGKKQHEEAFKDYVAKLIVLDGHKIIEISGQLDIPYGTLRRWVKRYRDERKNAEKEKQTQLLTATEYKELYEKEKDQKAELEEEIEILKKAMHIFNQEKK